MVLGVHPDPRVTPVEMAPTVHLETSDVLSFGFPPMSYISQGSVEGVLSPEYTVRVLSDPLLREPTAEPHV